MIFNSLAFGLFLAVVLIVFYAIPRRYWTFQKIALLGLSYVFYGWWDFRFVGLLVASTVVDFTAVRQIREHPSRRRFWLWVSVCFNLGTLGFFKYFNFFAESAHSVLASVGLSVPFSTLEVVLPVGISFYTFQTMSLTIDAYRGHVRRRYGLLDVALYVAFFPQLVAGPIVRATAFLPQVARRPRARPQLLVWGAWLIWWGLFKKVIIADGVAIDVDNAYASVAGGAISSLRAWKAAVGFSIQIYCDFSGYTDIAIGVAALLGIRLPKNFRSPYVSVGISDFWRRWHISLSTWLRDYLYIPLGGSRGSTWMTQRNLFITMLLGGLWHGASWNFVVWGAGHGLLLSLEQRLLGRRLHSRPSTHLRDIARVAIVFLIVTLLWVPFRAPDFATTWEYARSLGGAAGLGNLSELRQETGAYGLGAALVGGEWLRARSILPRRFHWSVYAVASATIVYLLFHCSRGSSAFIYFQF